MGNEDRVTVPTVPRGPEVLQWCLRLPARGRYGKQQGRSGFLSPLQESLRHHLLGTPAPASAPRNLPSVPPPVRLASPIAPTPPRPATRVCVSAPPFQRGGSSGRTGNCVPC